MKNLDKTLLQSRLSPNLLLLGSLLILLFSSKGEAAEYQVEGFVKMQMHMPSGAVQEQATIYFLMNVKGCLWSIRFTRDYGSQGQYAPNYEEESFDGHNIYYLANIKDAVERTKATGKRMGSNTAIAQVHEGEVPNLRDPDELGPVWLAYASSCYLQSRKSNLVQPAMAFDASGHNYYFPSHLELRAHWTLQDTEPGLPVEVIYFDDGLVRSPTGNGLVKRAEPYGNGFTNAIYQAESFTNAFGLRIPTRSSLRIFKPKPNGTKPEDLDLFVEYRINVTNLTREEVAMSFRPTIPGVTAVNDYRVGNQHYFSSNEWPSKEYIAIHDYYVKLRELNAHPHIRSFGGKMPWIAGIILAFLILASPTAYALWRKRFQPKRASRNK